MIPSLVYEECLGVSTDDLRVSSDSKSNFISLDEPARRGGEDGGVTIARSADCA